MGHPLRKDYDVGRIPVQFKGAPAPGERPTDARGDHDHHRRSDRRRDRRPRTRPDLRGRARSCAARDVDRRGRARCARSARCCACPRPTPRRRRVGHRRRAARRRDHDHQHGPAAPVAPTACCGSCSSSTARRCCAPSRSSATCTPAWRRRARSSPTSRARTNVTRMDYASPALQRAGLLAGHREAARRSRCPPRATWIRMLMTELNRISSHLLFMATNGMDLGAVVDDALRLARARGGAAASSRRSPACG